jgi:hypothetical protein
MAKMTDINTLIMEQDIDPSATLTEACAELRRRVDLVNKRPSIALRGGIYQGIDPDDFQAIEYEGWTIGYKLEDPPGPAMVRTIAIKSPVASINEIDANEFASIMESIYDGMLDKGVNRPVEHATAPDGSPLPDNVIRITQAFIPILLTEKKPGLVRL